MKSFDNINNNSSSNNNISNKSVNHYQQFLLNPSYIPDKQQQIGIPTIKHKYSPNLKFYNDGETVKYIKKPTNNTLIYSNFQSNYLSSADDIIFYYEVEILEMNEKSDICIGLGISTFPVHKQPGFSKKAKCSFGCKKNGEIRCSKIKSTQRIRSWGKGSIIGCGYNYITNEIFFTNDGEFKGAAFTTVRNYQFIGIVSLSYFKDKVRINYGQNPFKFDIKTLLKDYKSSVENKINSQKADIYDVHKIVQQYLYHNGYFETLKSFENQSQLEPITSLIESEEDQFNLISFQSNINNTDKQTKNGDKLNHINQALNQNIKQQFNMSQDQSQKQLLKNDKMEQEEDNDEFEDEEELENNKNNLKSQIDIYQDEKKRGYNRYDELFDEEMSGSNLELNDDFIKNKIKIGLNQSSQYISKPQNIEQQFHQGILDQNEKEQNLNNQNRNSMKLNNKVNKSNKQLIEEFINESKIEVNQVDQRQIAFDNIRKDIFELLHEMKYGQIIELMSQTNIFEQHQVLKRKLICFEFLKIYKEGKLTESMKYAQQNINSINDVSIEYLDSNHKQNVFTKLDILGVFCFERLEDSSLNLLFNQYSQTKLWDEINSTLLQFAGYNIDSNLQTILKQTHLIQQKMKENEMFEPLMYQIL